MNIRDTAERFVWTLVSAFLGAISVSGVIGISALQAGAVAAASAGANFLTVLARTRLAVLPDPGEAFGGAPDRGAADLGILLAFVVGFLLGAVCYATGILVG